jgi:acyl carrier protein
MISAEEFTRELEKEFSDIEPGTLSPQTNYRNIENWSSMHALIIIAFIDSTFDVQLNGEDLRKAETINDLYSIVKTKLN